MAYTRFYFQNVAPGYTPPTIKGAWDIKTSSVAKKLSKTKSGAITFASASHGALSYNPSVLVCRFISDPLPYTKTLAGNFRSCFGVKSSVANLLFPRIRMYVTQGNTDNVRGTLLEDWVWYEYIGYWGTLAQGREYPQTSPGWEDGYSLIPVTVQAGDRIVIEFGYFATPESGVASVPAATGYTYCGGTSSTNLAQGTSATSYPAWIEFDFDPFAPVPVNKGAAEHGTASEVFSLGVSLTSHETTAGADLVAMIAAAQIAEAWTGVDEIAQQVALFKALTEAAGGTDGLIARAALHLHVPESVAAMDAVTLIMALRLLITEGHQTAQAAVGPGSVYDPSLQTGLGSETGQIVATAGAADSGIGDVITSLLAALGVPDVGAGIDAILSVLNLHVYIRTDGRVDPLGVILLQGSREDIVPSPREYTVQVPGRAGELFVGADQGPRGLELKAGSIGSLSPSEVIALKRLVAGWLNPVAGVFNIAWENDPDRYLEVRLSGPIQPDEFNGYLEFNIPLRADRPFYIGSELQRMVGSGLAENDGNVETPATVMITGPVANPAVSIAGSEFWWDGTLGVGDVLVVNGERQTATFNGQNALASLHGAFPVLRVGGNVITAPGTVTTTWRNRWL